MLRHTPLPGEIYLHFKGKRYEIIAIACHSETEEELVIYKRCGEERIFARPLAMFCSEVDREKYPDAMQRRRFEKHDTEELI